jgi:hypothetical protein
VVISPVSGGDDLVLFGKDLPNEAVTVESRLRYEKIYYPGQSEATVHIMGQQQEPISLTGRFYDRNDFQVAVIPALADVTNPLVGGPRLKAIFLQGLFDSQAKMRLQWGQNIDVVGYLSNVRLTNRRHNVIGYEITFDPVAPFDPAQVETAASLFGFDQRTIGSLLDQTSIAARQLYESTYKTLYIARAYATADAAGGDLPDDLIIDPFRDEDRTAGLPDLIEPDTNVVIGGLGPFSPPNPFGGGS